MARTIVNGNNRLCANCVWWAGERYLEPFFGRVELESYNVKGKCMHRQGFYNLLTNSLSSCGHYEKHPIIK